jgi:hypothetical protein
VENPVSRRRVLQVSLPGLVVAPLVAAAAESGENATAAAPSGAAEPNKSSWTLVRPQGAAPKDFQQFVLHELAGALPGLVGGPATTTVTLQEAGAFSSASVRLGNADRPVDALLEIEMPRAYGPVSKLSEYLLAHCDHVQGWWVKTSLLYDTGTPAAIGARSSAPAIVGFVKRLDGTTPEHFARTWLTHAATEHAAREAKGTLGPYAQNRVVEPITPTAWVANGYAELSAEKLIPGVGARATSGRDEDNFQEWPPRILQGYTYRIL